MRAFPYQSIYDQSQTPPWDRLTDTKDHRTEAMANWTNGVYPGSDGWKVEPGAGMTVTVSPGMGRIQGVFCYDEAGPGGAVEPRTLALQAAHTSLDRIDLVVVRHMDSTAMRKTDWYIVTGEPSLNPIAPAITRNSDVYELCVAKVFVARGTNTVSAQRITDTRLDYTLCGLCTTRIMDAAIDDIKALLLTAVDETTAGHLQSQIDANKNLMQGTNYAITDSTLKALFGNTATLKSILQKLGARYIVETNPDYPDYTSNYRWVKYSDGIAEVEWQGAIGLGAGVAWAGGYHHTQAAPASYPIAFIEVPKMVEAKRNGAKIAMYCGGAMTQATWSTVWHDGYSGSYTGGAFDNVHLLMRGRWK